MTRHRRVVPAALALVLLPFTSSPAHAADTTFYGGCHFSTQTVVTGADRYLGEWDSRTVLYSRTEGNVVNGTVTCELRINGVTAVTSGTYWGSGVVVFAEPLSFTASDTDVIDLCTVVDFTSDDTPTETRCLGATTLEFPPEPISNWLGDLLDWVSFQEITYVDPVACEVLPLLAPVPPPFTVDGQGDVYFAGELLWDCPPYDHLPSPDPPGTLPPLLPGFEPAVPTGGGYNTGSAGVLALTSPDHDVASACAYVRDPATGEVVVVGTTATLGASATSIRCRLTDAAGEVLFDRTVSLSAPIAELHASVTAPGPITVCTEGTGVWGDHTVTVGLACRPGEPLDRLVP